MAVTVEEGWSATYKDDKGNMVQVFTKTGSYGPFYCKVHIPGSGDQRDWTPAQDVEFKVETYEFRDFLATILNKLPTPSRER